MIININITASDIGESIINCLHNGYKLKSTQVQNNITKEIQLVDCDLIVAFFLSSWVTNDTDPPPHNIFASLSSPEYCRVPTDCWARMHF